MRPQYWGVIPKIVLISVIFAFSLTILTSMALIVLQAMGIVDMSNAALSFLGGVTITQINLMRAVVRLTGQIISSGN
ncbi:hypothetical protein HV318_03655 [Enterobacter sp. RHBSTW-00901]|uniref:hypothetical protein n=1 Tax=Enterobacter TaxID=547 RepID=UPI0015F4C932|nr:MULTISPECIES: hypothetical protein [Enterobacter]MBA7854144.1 hypothetical protein [Enterobacter sp. RHBSTW-00901]MCR1319983.1 hypothetical protein [Enterobacter soli]